jgi:hypothetical protein
VPSFRGAAQASSVPASIGESYGAYAPSAPHIRTSLAPSFGLPLNRLQLLPYATPAREPDVRAPPELFRSARDPIPNSFGGDDDEASVGTVTSRYLAYATPEKVIGLLRTPLDGAPHRVLGLVAHSGAIDALGVLSLPRNLCAGGSGIFVVSAGTLDLPAVLDFSASPAPSKRDFSESLSALQSALARVPPSAQDSTVALWHADLAAFDSIVDVSAVDCPWPSMLAEGGTESELYSELQDFFVLCQLSERGASCDSPLSGRISLNSVPDLFAAMGVYLSRAEIDHISAEVAEDHAVAHRYLVAAAKSSAAQHDRSGSVSDSDPGASPPLPAAHLDHLDQVTPRDAPHPTPDPRDSSPHGAAPTVAAGDGVHGPMVLDGTSLTLPHFVRLFVNHRPLTGVSNDDIRAALRRVGGEGSSCLLARDSLLRSIVHPPDASDTAPGEVCTLRQAAVALTSLLSAAHGEDYSSLLDAISAADDAAAIATQGRELTIQAGSNLPAGHLPVTAAAAARAQAAIEEAETAVLAELLSLLPEQITATEFSSGLLGFGEEEA